MNRAVACEAVDLMRAPPSPDVPGALSAGGRLRLAQYDRVVGEGQPMLLDGVNHVAWISKDVARLGAFYERVFDAAVGPTRPHGPGETMTVIDIGPATQLNVFVIDGNTEADRQTPMWGRGRIDHVGLAAASREAFDTIRERLVDAGASDGTVNDFGGALSVFFRDPDGLEGEVLLKKT